MRSYRNITYNQTLQSNNSRSSSEFAEQLGQHYGIMAARLCGVPPDIVRNAERLLPEIEVKTLHCESDVHDAVLIRRNEIRKGAFPTESPSATRALDELLLSS